MNGLAASGALPLAADVGAAWQQALAAQLRPGEKVCATLELDLDAQLQFRPGLLLATDQRLIGFDAPGLAGIGWDYRDGLALAAPAGTARPILQRMGDLIREANDTPAVLRARDAAGQTEGPILLADFDKALAEERPVWQNATRDLNITPE